MFPWLKGEPEVQSGFGAPNKPQPGINRLRSIEIGANKKSQSDQDLGRAQRNLDTDRSLNNPYYQDNTRQTSRSGRQRLDSLKGRGISQNRPSGDNIAFEDDYQHKSLEKNKQQYQDFYKNNVSEFQKRMNGQAAPSYEDKKKRLQFEQNEGEGGIMTRLQYKSNRLSVSPSEYANVLKRQIEEKKELQRQQKREEDSFPRQEVISRNQQPDNKGQQGERNFGQEEGGGGRKVVSLHQQQVQKNRGSLNEEYEDPYSNDIRGRRSPYQQGGTGGMPVVQTRGTILSLEPNKKREEEFRQGRNFLGDIQDRDIKEQEQRKARQQEFYKGLENERKEKMNKVGNREVSWGKEQSMVEQLGEKLAKEEEKKSVLKADLAEELMQQIKEKKRLQREEKEKQEMLDRKYDEKVKAEADYMKQKYEAELQGKQHEIKSVKMAHDKKKQEQKDKLNESRLSKNLSRSPDLTKIDASQILPQDQTLEDQENSNYPLPHMDGQVDNVLRDLNSRGGNELDLRGFQLESSHQQIPQQQQQQQQQQSQQQQQQLQQQQQQQQQNSLKTQPNLPQSPNLQVYRKTPQSQAQGQSPNLSSPQATQNNQYQQQYVPQQQNQMQYLQQQEHQPYQLTPQQPKLFKSQFQQQPIFQPSTQPYNRQLEGQYQREEMYQKQDELFAGREVNQHWNPPKFWEYKDRKNEEELNQLRAQLDAQTSLLSTEAIKIRQDLRAAAEKKTQALVDLENLKDQLRRQNHNESAKLQQLRNNMNILSNTSNIDYLQPISNNPSKLAGAANISLLNFSSFSTNNNHNSSSIHNQSSLMGGNGILSSNRQHFSRQQQPDMLDKFLSNNSNFYGQKLNNSKGGYSSQPLDYKLEKRLNGVTLDKADMQLLEVDNLLNNLRYPI